MTYCERLRTMIGMMRLVVQEGVVHQMQSLIRSMGVVFVATTAVASAQAPSPTVDSYLGTAKMASGTDWAGTFLRLCIAPPAGPRAGLGGAAGGRGSGRGTPARETWYAEPAKVADNLYFLGTKIHSAWAITGSQGIIVIEALFDYAAKDEILEGLKKVGLDPGKVKYVILPTLTATMTGAPSCFRTRFRACTSYTARKTGIPIDKLENRPGGKPKRDMVGDDGMNVSVGMPPYGS